MRTANRPATLAALVILVALVVPAAPAHANVALTRIGSDPFTNAGFQHRTAVGSDTFQNGTTIFTASMVGRGTGGGSAGVSYAAYNKQRQTWTSGILDGITVDRGGAYTAVADVRVGYFLYNYNIWVIATLATGGPGGSAILVSRSSDDGRTFRAPRTAATGQLTNLWFTCAFTASADRNCYLGYTDAGAGNAIRVHVSGDGGLSWGPARSPAGGATGVAVNAISQNFNEVVVPYLSTGGQIRSFRSTDSGLTWQASVPVATVRRHTPAGGLRDPGLPSVQKTRAGTVYVAWADCRFRAGCAANDIVISRSADGVTWTAPRRVPIDATTSGVDHFLPALGVDPGDGWVPDRLALAYHYYPSAACTAQTCQLSIGFVSSTNAGATWSAPTRLAGPMRLSWLPQTAQGRTVGDHLSTEVVWSGNAFPVLPVAVQPGGTGLDQSVFVPTGGVAITGGSVS